MKLIDENRIDKIVAESKFEDFNREILANPIVNESLSRYLTLTQFPERFKDVHTLDLYYNRYYWYLKFLIIYQKEIGSDAGLEQQEFKILEEGEGIPNIDWHEIERISNELKGGNMI